MLLKRVITALIIAPIAMALVLFLPQSLFAEVLMLVLIIGLFEWDNLTTKSNRYFVLGAMAVLIVAVISYLLASQIIENTLFPILPSLAMLGVLFWIAQYFTLAKGIEHRRPIKLEMMLGLLATLFAWSSMVWLRMQTPDGEIMVLIAIMVVWGADTFAYAAGVTMGKHKLAPSISPGKTIEGVAGGMIGAVLFAGISAHYFLSFDRSQTLAWLVAAAAAAAISVVGDLYISRLKRHAGAKDSGKLLPGHGGLLDRIDGMIAAMPVFAAVWWLLS